MILLNMLEPTDTILPTDWCRPLRLETMGGGQSDYYSFRNTYGGSPENNVEWVRVDAVLGEVWFGETLGRLNKNMSAPYEMIRGNIPKSHQLNMKGYPNLAKTMKELKKLTASQNDWAGDNYEDDIPF
jgi:hypothetical protein